MKFELTLQQLNAITAGLRVAQTSMEDAIVTLQGQYAAHMAPPAPPDTAPPVEATPG